MEVIEVGEIGLSSRDLLLADGGICSVVTCRGEADRGKAGPEAEVGGGAVVLEAGRGDAMAAGTASGAIKERRSAMRCAGIDGVYASDIFVRNQIRLESIRGLGVVDARIHKGKMGRLPRLAHSLRAPM